MCSFEYTIHASGALTVQCSVSVPSSWPVLPRVGLRFLTADGYSAVDWLGRGPFENYCDRKVGAPFGIYSGDTSSQFVPYIRPGECGAKCDVAWARLSKVDSGSRVPSLFFTSSLPFQFSALNHLPSDLASVLHPEQLVPRPFTVMSMDHRHMGIGGDDSWSSCVHSDHLISPGKFEFTFGIMGSTWQGEEGPSHPPRQLMKLCREKMGGPSPP